MKELVTDRCFIKFISYDENVKIECPNECYYMRDRNCPHKGKLSIGNDIIKMNVVKLLVKNTWDKLLRISVNQFELIDNFGFTHPAIGFCDSYFKDNRSIISSYELPPNSQMYYLLVTNEIENGAKLSKIGFTDWSSFHCLVVDNDFEENGIEDYKIENYKLKKEIEKLKEKVESLTIRHSIDDKIQYATKRDNEYFYVISNEKDETISFNREFDKSKGNYNWINAGDPLITLKLENVMSYMSCPTKIESPVSGIFEFDKNKLIQSGEVICRIKLYDQSQKQEIINQLEEEEIKEAVYKKERKKKIERQALDELILQGLVFNSYTSKEGNRVTVPADVANAVWNRDGGKCVQCGSQEKLEFDHIIPFSKGGATTYRNLQLLCEKCNREKSNNIGVIYF